MSRTTGAREPNTVPLFIYPAMLILSIVCGVPSLVAIESVTLSFPYKFILGFIVVLSATAFVVGGVGSCCIWQEHRARNHRLNPGHLP
jgi:hypothetical protein